jgi:hypothetical protein
MELFGSLTGSSALLTGVLPYSPEGALCLVALGMLGISVAGIVFAALRPQGLSRVKCHDRLATPPKLVVVQRGIAQAR